MGLRDMFGKKEEATPDLANLPRHVALTAAAPRTGAQEFAQSQALLNIKNIIKASFRLNIPLITITLQADITDAASLDFLTKLLRDMSQWETLHREGVKVGVLGKWYDLPGQIVTPIKTVLDATHLYDKFFLNLCINYDGQEEIVDACRLIARQVRAGKVDPEGIDKSLLKENIYTSYFMPPDLIICTGRAPILSGMLLWDGANAMVRFAGRDWQEFDRDQFLAILTEYSRRQQQNEPQ